MSDCSVYVGLDYHSKSVQACVMDRGGRILMNRRCPNDAAQIDRLVRTHASGQVFGAIESCTGAADLAEELILRAGWSVDLAHAGYVARIKQSPDKHDWGDARLLADLERVGYLPKVWLASQEVRELRRLVRYRQQIVSDRRNIRLRINALLRDHRQVHAAARPWTRAWLRWLQEEATLPDQSRWIISRQLSRMAVVLEELQAVEERLATLTAGDPIVLRLQSQKGIGPVTAWTLRAEIGRFDRFRNGKQLARFCGLSPRNASSGERQADSGLIRAGNRQLRATLIEAAHRLARFDTAWRPLALQLVERGKPKCLAIAAVANRWVRWLYHEMRACRPAA